MNRAALCIRMLLILRSRSRISTKELAEQLETNPRNIREFRRELEQAGYTIQEIRGRSGGYTLLDQNLMPVPELSYSEKQALREALQRVLQEKTSCEAEGSSARQASALPQALIKVLAAADPDDHLLETVLQKKDSVSAIAEEQDLSDLKHPRLEILDQAAGALASGHVIRLLYHSATRAEPASFLFDPYELVSLQGQPFLVGWFHESREYKSIPLLDDNLVSLEKTRKKFVRDPYFQFSQFADAHPDLSRKIERYVIWVDPAVQKPVEQFYWGTSMRQEKSNGSGLVYSFLSDRFDRVEEGLFSFGTHVRLLKPEGACKSFTDKLQQLLNCYEQSVPAEGAADALKRGALR